MTSGREGAAGGEVVGQLPDGRPVQRFTLTNAHGLVARILDYGAVLTELHTPDQHGNIEDIVLGFSDLEPYLWNPHYLGATVGRVANRIARGVFTLGGHQYNLACNNGPNHLHGGNHGFHQALWQAQRVDPSTLRLTHQSPDGDEGYPGRVDIALTMQLTEDNALRLDYTAETDQPTPVNLTNHSYFNLAGQGTVLDHELVIYATAYTPTDATLIPTGELRPVAGTPLDFTRPIAIGRQMRALARTPPGYDDNFVVARDGPGLVLAAEATHAGTGRRLEAWTTEAGLQLYTGNYLDGLVGKGGVRYERHAGFTLEAQGFPDAVNHSSFPDIIVRPGTPYRQTTVFRFGMR